MNDDLIQRLLFAESDFLTALEGGPDMLASYHQTLSVLPDILSTAKKTGGAGNETLSLAHTVASRILNIARCFLDIKHEEEFATAQLCREMDALSLDAQPKYMHQDSDHSISHPPISSTTLPLNAASSYPTFLTSAYQWLLDNLHNPYPTAEVKTRIAVASSCQVSSINSWFTNARRRIGWTTLCRERFCNCRADMLDAAYRALVNEDPQRPLSPELRHCFVAMKVAAEGLYSSTFTKSAFAGDLDAMVNDVTKKDKESPEVEKCHQAANFTKVREIKTHNSLVTEKERICRRLKIHIPLLTHLPQGLLYLPLTTHLLMRAKRRRMLHLRSLPAPNAVGHLWNQLTSLPPLPVGPSNAYGVFFPGSRHKSVFMISCSQRFHDISDVLTISTLEYR